MPLCPIFERLEPRWMLAADVAPPLVALPATAGGSIQGHVYQSQVADLGNLAGSTPLAGVEVQLLDSSGNVLEVVTTGATGEFAFVGLSDGHFGVREVQPAGFGEGIAQAGSGGGSVLGRNHIIDIPLAAGTQLVGYNFWDTPESANPGGGFPPGDRPIFLMFTGNVVPNGSSPLTDTVRQAAAIELTSNQIDAVSTAEDITFRLLEIFAPPQLLPQSGEFEGGCGQLMDDDADEDASEELPTTDPFAALWELAQLEPTSNETEQIPDETPAREESTTEDGARAQAIAQFTANEPPRARHQSSVISDQ